MRRLKNENLAHNKNGELVMTVNFTFLHSNQYPSFIFQIKTTWQPLEKNQLFSSSLNIDTPSRFAGRDVKVKFHYPLNHKRKLKDQRIALKWRQT